jgi:hypothetical protein
MRLQLSSKAVRRTVMHDNYMILSDKIIRQCWIVSNQTAIAAGANLRQFIFFTKLRRCASTSAFNSSL